MRKILVLTIIGCLLFTGVSSAVTQFNADQRQLHAENTNNTTSWAKTDMTTSTVLVAETHLVIGYSFTPIIQASEATADCWLEIHDAAATSSDLTSTFIVERRIDRSGTVVEYFPYPVEIKNGIVAGQSAYTQLIIYYERP